ncbi:hypothetical protein TRFO_31201 [Tritrichomonas foetus]|uniref:Uncharacterized protein n=1 Tax=Tritrichomonas foetus TaxID=1144522 RepID=A0A1J4JT38_9EUKA|nr:hypothetical protein [Tritrichomonas foetus]OHT01906.1 hypothetical protein TRFO_31201 [Tritrichomonas foetus]|eukprot:OHT01906.1 hypothetical protein TRFO_31201 [Tritrichomonas foetus]
MTTLSARAAMKKQQLKELNNELIKENSLLRSQFEEAVEITSQFQDLHQKNQQLLAQIGTLQAEKEDLDHRLEISLATNKELTKRLSEEKRNHSQQNDTNINAMNNEIEKVKEQAKAQLDSVLEELEKVKSVHEKDVLQQKTIVGRIDRVLQSGERFFNTKLSTVDDLINFFEKPQVSKPENAPKVQPIPIQQNCNSNIEQLEKRIKHLKTKLRSASHEKADLENQIAKLAHDAAEQRCEHASEVSELQRRINLAADEKTASENAANMKISSLEKSIESLKTELAQARAVQVVQQPIQVQQPLQQQQQPIIIQSQNNLPKVQKSKSLQEDVERINNLVQEVDELTEKLELQNKKIDDQQRLIVESETNNLNLKMQIEKAQAEITTLNTLKDASNAEIETLRNALHTKQQASTEPIQMPKPAPNVVKYQRVIEEQKSKLLSLNQANDKQKKLIEKQERDIATLNTKLDASIEQTRKVNEDFADYRSKVESKRPLTAEDFLPADSFRCPEFDGVLSACIQKIASNPSLQPVTKIQSCFRAIHAHLSQSLKEIQIALDDTTKENQFLSESFNKFIVDLSIAICDQPTTIEDFFKLNGGARLLNSVAKFRVKFDDMKHQSDRLQEIVAHLDQNFPTGNEDPLVQITDMKNQLISQCEEISNKTSKLKKLRRDLRELAQASENMKNENASRIEDLTNKLTGCTATVNQLEKSNASLKSENSHLQSELLEATRELAKSEECYKKREAEVINKIIQEHTEKMNELNNQYQSLQQTYTELVEEYNEQAEHVQELEQKVETQKRSLASKEREINELNRQLVEQSEATAQRLEKEKKQLTETYQCAIDELTEQCAKHRSDVERMATVVAENEKQMAIVRNECNILKKQKIKIENEMKSLLAKVDRERKLLETNYTAKRIAYESEMSQKMNEERQKLEQEKRKLCGYGAEAFKMFFNANTSIDEKSFRNVIENARDELTRLTKSDAAVRRIVAARDNQTTEDAVAQVLMTSA